MSVQELTKKKRIRAGHKSSVTRFIAQVKETLKTGDWNAAKLKQHLQLLQGKQDILNKLDAEILEGLETEDEITGEIEQADIFKENVAMTIIDLETALGEQHNDTPLQIQTRESSRENGARPETQVQTRDRNDESSRENDARPETPNNRDIREGTPRSVTPSSSSPSRTEPTLAQSRGGKVKLPKLTLRKFSGDPTAWTPFWDSYESAIHQNPDLSDIDKFNYLQSLVEHSAAEAIAGLTLSSSNYAEAITVLKKRFGNKQQLINKHMEALLSLPAVTSVYELRNLRQLYDKVESHVRSLKSIGIAASSYGNLLASILMKKIPSELCLIVSRETVEDNWNLDSLLKVLEKEIGARERASTNTSAQPRKLVRDYATTAALLSDTSPLCVFCDQTHYSNHCRVVADQEKRKQLLLKAGRCFICLKRGHLSRDCRSARGCYNCGGKHNSSICKSQRSGSKNAQNTSPTSTEQTQNVKPQMQHQTQSAPVLAMYVDVKTPVLLQTARAAVFQPHRPSLTTIVRIILDSGSQRSYVTDMVRKNLALHTEQTETIVMKTFGCHEKVQICDVVKLAIKTATGMNLVLPFLVVPSICEPIAGQPITLARDTYPHLFGLNLADDSGMSESLGISVLIGADHYWKLATGRVCRGKTGPTAIETVLGWVLSGPVPGITCGETSTNLVSAHALKLETSVLCCHDCDLDQRLKKYWDLETLGIKEGEMPAYSQFMECITFQDGRYCVQLPWKNPHPHLPDNFKLSQRRLCGLLRRLRQEPSLLQRYDTVIKEQLKEGIVEVVQDPWTSVVEKLHYIPHHGVIRDDKQTTKLRIVYDASAKEDGPSLNDCLYAGPPFGQFIFDILVRFRLHQVALVADIEKAFLMISVDKKDIDVLRFLWVDNVHADLLNLQVLRFTRVVFGVASSPFLLNATLKYHLEKYRSADPETVDRLERALYVDDVTYGADSVEEAFVLFTKSKLWLKEGGFNLRKFVTNSSMLQRKIDLQESCPVNCTKTVSPHQSTSEELSFAKVALGVDESHLKGLKVLGIQWNPDEDMFIFDLSNLCKRSMELEPTKRGIVGIVSRIYDPIGIVSPVTIQFKMMFQELCTNHLNWDDQLSGELLVKWKKLLSEFQQVEPLRFPRCYFRNSMRTSSSYTLHGFGDASQRAYAAVVYLLIETPDGRSTRFVGLKTRVAPVKGHSIPRLELLAALLLARLISSLESALKSEIALMPSMCYTDSKVALYWIKGESQEWRQFVQNRVNEIRTLVPAQHWKHCSGHDNPADLPSRGISLPELLSKSVWFSGPSWLSSPVQASRCDEESMPDECILEMKKSAQHVLLVGGEIGTVMQCQRFSSLGRLLRVTAYVLKFIAIIKARGSVSAGLSSKDVSDAEEFWIKSSQAALLQDVKFQVWKTQFGLYYDNEIWRCGGMLRNADLDVCAKHPILLPSGHHFTMLVIRQSHEKVLHGGVKETLTELRSRFWVVKGRSVVKKLLHKCVICRMIDGKPYASSLPPPLPEFRVTQSPPFAFTGLDYAGPLYLKGTEDKVWICLFTCCATRALHLDLVVDMTTEAFIRCFKRFVARRGIPRVIISDNSKTFKSADKVIAEILNRPDIGEFFAGVRVKWNFNLEKAPWWGGFFERLVKSTKRCLKKIIGTTKLSYEELQTVLVEVEAILNSRPLTYVSSEDLEEPLTPSHLLTGRRLISLPDPQDSEDDPEYHASHTPEVLTRRMKHLTVMLDHFWKRWKLEYLVELREMHRYAQKPTTPHVPVSVGDVVLVYDEDHPRIFWKLAKVEGLIKGSDGVVRGAKVRVRSANGFTVLKRPVQHLFPLEVNIDHVSVAEDVRLRLSQQKGQDEKEVQEERKVRPARASAQRARQKITEWMKSN